MVAGRRVTDEKSMEVTSMVLNGLVNTQILGICRELDIAAVGVSGVDAGLVRAHKRPPVQVEGQMVDYGFVGDIDLIDAKVLQQLLDDGLMPVVSPVSADDKGTLLNINADTVAAGIGAALKAEKLMLCTGAPGILESLDDPRSIISYTDLAGLKRLKDQGSLKDGMLPKAKAIEDAIRGGVRRVHVTSYKSPDSILAEVFTNEGTGTLIVENISALSPAEQQQLSMSRLWDKGAPLDERVLRYTAGEDHALDNRLVAVRRARLDCARGDAARAGPALGRRSRSDSRAA